MTPISVIRLQRVKVIIYSVPTGLLSSGKIFFTSVTFY
jgi:hypothetical protein